MVRLLIAAGVACLGVAAFWLSLFPIYLKIPRDLHHAAQVTTVLCVRAGSRSITAVGRVRGGVLSAICEVRYPELNFGGADAGEGHVGVILILRSGRGLISLALPGVRHHLAVRPNYLLCGDETAPRLPGSAGPGRIS